MSDGARPLRVMVVSSVGGHLREVLELGEVLTGAEVAVVVNDETQVAFRPPFLRRYRIVHAERDAKVLVNLLEAAWLLFRERPDVLLSTGAGPAVPFYFLARLLGPLLDVETVFIEFFGAVDTPSLTARLVYPLARHFFVQWGELLRHFPRARVVGPAFARRQASTPAASAIATEPVVGTFAAVGTSDRPFERLIAAVDTLAGEGRLPSPVLIQGGPSRYPVRHARLVPFLPDQLLEHHLRTAGAIVCHAGSGILGTCLGLGRRPLVMPRLAVHGEAVNDHQRMLATALARSGQAVLCESEAALREAASTPSTERRENQAAEEKGAETEPLIDRTLRELLREAAQRRGRRYR